MGIRKLPIGLWRFVQGVLVAFVLFGIGIFAGAKGCVDEVFGQSPPIGIYPPDPYPIPSPIRPDELNGLDPVEQRRMRDRQMILNLERRVAAAERRLVVMERLARVQIRQIDQLQRYTFGIGRYGKPGRAIGDTGPGAKPEPIGTPAELVPQEDVADE